MNGQPMAPPLPFTVTGGRATEELVVTLNSALTPPIVNVAMVVVPGIDEAITCTVTLSPLPTMPGAPVGSPPLMLY